MNQLPMAKRTQILGMLVEGMSINATARIADVSKVTVLKLLVDVGTACADHQDRTLRNLPCRKLQADEIWTFVHCKASNVPKEKRGALGLGDIWCWTSICADCKLVPAWVIGRRNTKDAIVFMQNLASRLKHRVQLTTDGHLAYLEAVESAFGSEVDYSMLVKLYGQSPEGERRYSPPVCVGTRMMRVAGKPDIQHTSTSYVERLNLGMRMNMRRFTRLTNGFSKKVENLSHAVALHFMYYNFARIHQTLRVTPAMEAGIEKRIWTLDDIARLADQKIFT